MMMNCDFELGGERPNPRVEESKPVVDDSSSDNRLDSASVDLTGSSKNFTGVSESRMGSGEGNVSHVNNTIAGDSNKLGDFESGDKDGVSGRNHDGLKCVKSEQQKGQRRKEGKSKESVSPVYDSMLSMFDDFAANGIVATGVKPSMEVSSGHGFEVGDMVWGKVKSHPWWPGFVFSEEFANPSVRRSKREGLLLVAFFGDSSYGWFDPSELIPFDSNFAEKSRQTNSRTFVKAVEEAMDEVSRRSALGLSCMCRNKQNFRPTGVQGFFAVDVADYDPGAVYSIDAIGKARDSFQPGSALDFVRQLALEPTGGEDADVDFIKNKATVVSYRKAVYVEFDETYAQAFGYQPAHPSPGSAQEPPSGKTPSKAPLSGRQVFADTSGKGKSPAKPNKPKDHSKKDKYLFKRREESKDVKTHQKPKSKVTSSPQPSHLEDDYMLQKKASATDDEVASMEADRPIVLDFDNPAGEVAPDYSGQTPELKPVEDDKIVPDSDLVDDKSSSEAMEAQDGVPDLKPPKKATMQRVDGGPKKMKVSKRLVGELGSGKSVLPEKKKKRKKEPSTSDGAHIVPKEGGSFPEKVSANKSVQSDLASKPPIEDPFRSDSRATTSSSHTSGTQELLNSEAEIPQVLNDLHSLALDPFHAVNRGWPVKVRQVFLRFRSLVFQKSLNLSPLADDEANDTHLSKSPAGGSENGIRALPPVKPLAKSSGRPDDPTKGGRKRGPSDRQEENAAKKKKKIGDIRNLTEKKVIKKTNEPPARDIKPAGVMASRKTEQRAPEPTMLMMKFPFGGSLPSINELKARFARYGPMDHSATRIYWNTFMCRVVYRHKAHAQAAQRFVVGSSSLFGNTDVKCYLKEVGESEPLPKVPKEDHQPAAEDRVAVLPATPGVQLKSCLKKSGVEEAGGNGGKGIPRVKFMLGGDENNLVKKNESSFSSSSSHATMDFNSKNFHKVVLPPSTTVVTTVTTTATTVATRPPPPPPPPLSNSLHYGTTLPPPRPLNHGSEMTVPPPPGNFVHDLHRPNTAPQTTQPNVDITQQMLSLLTKCNDVVTNVTSLLGYRLYHPL